MNGGPEPAGDAALDRTDTERVQRLYLDLLKRAVTGYLFVDLDHAARWFELRTGRELSRNEVTPALAQQFRMEGADWPNIAYSMCGLLRLENLEACIRRVVADEVSGDVLEAGVWRGGAALFARGVLKALGDTTRTVWLADSFQGLPTPTSAVDVASGMRFDLIDYLKVDVDRVRRAFELFDLLDEQVRFLEGFFDQTLPTAPVERLAVLRLDGDMYSSTMTTLEHLYPKVSRGGFVIVDDYVIPTCRAAVEEYRRRHGIRDPLVRVDWAAVYWRVA